MKRFLRPRNLIPVLGLLAGLLGSAAPAAAQEISITDANPVVEGGNASFEVAITNPGAVAIGPVTFNYATADGTAAAGSDYTAEAGAVVVPLVPPGGTTVIIDIATTDDNVYEPAQENFFVNLSAIVGATAGDTQGQGFINDNDPIPTYSITDVALAEGNAGTTNFTFTVTLSNPSQLPTSLGVNTADGTAIAADSPGDGTDNDYVAIAGGTVTFTPGDVSEDITVQVRGDLNFEPDETFTVNLGPVTAGTANAADAQGLGTILNDDIRPTIRLGNATVVEGNAGTSILSFPIFLETGGVAVASTEEIRVDAITLVGTGTSALPGSDYQPLNTEIIIPANTPSGAETVDVLVNGDFTPESDETLFVQLSDPENAFLDSDGDVATGTIQNDDLLANQTLSISDATVAEGTGTGNQLTFTVTLNNPQQVVVTVPYSITDGTATSGSDFSPTSGGTLTFAPGQTSATIVVNTVPDTNVEPNETFTVVLGAPTNATLADGSGLGTINNDDNVVGFSINDVAINEPDSGAANLAFTVTLSQALTSPITVQYRTVDGTALAGQDYTPAAAGTLTFAPGATTQTISVPVLGDTLAEPQEQFTVELFNISDTTQANFIDATGVGTINDTDLVPTFTISDVTTTEGNAGSQNFAFTVTLSSALSSAVTVQYRTLDGSALGGEDFAPVAGGTLTFAPGVTSQTINIPVLGDLNPEGDETFVVELFNVSNATIVQIGDGSGLGTIQNDDNGPAQISIADNAITEGNAGSQNLVFTVTLSKPLSSAVSVQYSTNDGPAGEFGAQGGPDYTPVTGGTITFQPGVTTQTITIPITGDLIDERNETFTVVLSNLSAAPSVAVLADDTAVGTINDNDAPPTFSIDDVTVCEDEGVAVFTITKSAVSGLPSTVTVNTTGVTATEGADFASIDGTVVNFGPTELTKTVSVSIIDDAIADNSPTFVPETFQVILSNPVDATIADGTGVGTILDDEGLTVEIEEIPVDNLWLTDIDINGLAKRCFRVTLTNQCGDIVADFGDDIDELIQITIDGDTGSNTPVPVEIITDDEGEQIFCYTPLFPGQDDVTVDVFVNGVLVASDTITITVDVVPPGVRDFRINGSGFVTVAGAQQTAQFSLNANLKRNGRAAGSVNVVLPFFGGNPFGIGTIGTAQFRSTRIEAMVAGDATTGGHAGIIIGRGQVIVGRRRFNVRFRVDVLDNGTPGVPNDRFVLTLLEPLNGTSVPIGGALKHARGRGIVNDVKIDGPGFRF